MLSSISVAESFKTLHDLSFFRYRYKSNIPNIPGFNTKALEAFESVITRYKAQERRVLSISCSVSLCSSVYICIVCQLTNVQLYDRRGGHRSSDVTSVWSVFSQARYLRQIQHYHWHTKLER